MFSSVFVRLVFSFLYFVCFRMSLGLVVCVLSFSCVWHFFFSILLFSYTVGLFRVCFECWHLYFVLFSFFFSYVFRVSSYVACLVWNACYLLHAALVFFWSLCVCFFLYSYNTTLLSHVFCLLSYEFCLVSSMFGLTHVPLFLFCIRLFFVRRCSGFFRMCLVFSSLCSLFF